MPSVQFLAIGLLTVLALAALTACVNGPETDTLLLAERETLLKKMIDRCLDSAELGEPLVRRLGHTENIDILVSQRGRSARPRNGLYQSHRPSWSARRAERHQQLQGSPGNGRAGVQEISAQERPLMRRTLGPGLLRDDYVHECWLIKRVAVSREKVKDSEGTPDQGSPKHFTAFSQRICGSSSLSRASQFNTRSTELGKRVSG